MSDLILNFRLAVRAYVLKLEILSAISNLKVGKNETGEPNQFGKICEYILCKSIVNPIISPSKINSR